MSDTAPRHVTLAGDLAGEYVVDEQLDDGRLILRPEQPYPSVVPSYPGRRLTEAEFDDFIAEYGVQPADGEG